MRNTAYRLAFVASIGGLALLMSAGAGDDVRTTLGVAVLAGAALLMGVGKALDVLGYVEEGASEAEDRK